MLELLVERVFKDHILRKLYHLLGGGLLIVGLVLMDRKWFVLMG